MEKKWNIAPQFYEGFKDKFPEISEVVLQLLYNRGLKTQDEIDVFFGPDYNRDQHDPYLFNDMEKAVERILRARDKKEQVVVYGDYDADGVTSTSVMVLTLRQLGVENLDVYIPNRLLEGYGMNNDAVEEIASKGTDLIITVDCGISNDEEVALAKKKGIDVIVTDHHLEPDNLPLAYAIICPSLSNEKYPFRKLAGVGVAFKVAQALLRKDAGNNEAFEKWLLDLVAIGTVADCMPLLGENRTFVKWGLLVLNKTKRLGVQELIETALINNKEIDSRTIGFQIAPRLNAAGRMDHANTAYKLLSTSDEVEAIAIANDLNEKNRERQKVTEEMMKISIEQIGEPGADEKILFSQYDGWSPGLVGLAAGKLADKFSRPVIVFGKSGEKYVGSGRSRPEFNIVEGLHAAKEFIEEYGGHSQACGLTIVGEDNLAKFKEKISSYVKKKLDGVEMLPHLDVEAEIRLDEANWDLVDTVEKFAPFGEGNEEPVFISRDLVVYDILTMGATGKHLKIMIENKLGAPKKFVGFGIAEEWIEKIKCGDKIDIAYKLNVNEWNGNREIEFRIEDIKIK